ncbi:MAG: MFS transporter [Ferruginibacter sp.]|nr:MFS transporter [Cytophagales bacterium]
MQKNNPRIIRAWCTYDWANSVYSLVITSTIFPIYFGQVARNPRGGDLINFLGVEVRNSALFSFAVSFAYLLVAVVNPLLTAIADYSHRRKRFLKLFCYLGAGSCALLYYFTRDTLVFSLIAFVFATVGYSGSIVFYNAYLPQIATVDRLDAVSARGYALGYVGSVLLLLFNLSMILMPGWYGGISGQMASRVAFLSTGVWWAGFAQYTFYHLPNPAPQQEPGLTWIFKGYQELRKVVGALGRQRRLKRYLLAFFFYSLGVQTVMYVAVVFADQELHLPADNLIITVLIIQLVAIGGAYLFAGLSRRLGNVKALMLAVLVWLVICPWAYFIDSSHEVYALATLIGSVMGGIQALSRSTYAKFIPEDSRAYASYFNVYDVVEKLSIVTGTGMYGLVKQFTPDVRTSFLVLAGTFLLGFFLLARLIPESPRVSTQPLRE